MTGVNITPVPRVAIIVVAAGIGTRLAAGAPKAFVGIDEHTILRHALDACPRGATGAGRGRRARGPRGRCADATRSPRAGDRRELVSVVTGGDHGRRRWRPDSRALWGDVEIVLVHDAARALTPPAVFERVIAAVDAGHVGAIPVLPVIDTIKRVDRRG